jgi:hypothetical protein
MQRSIAKWYVRHFRALDVKALNDLMFVGGLLWGGFWTMMAFRIFGPGWLSFFGAVVFAGFLCAPITMAYIRNLEQRILEELEEQNDSTTATTFEDEISSMSEMS